MQFLQWSDDYWVILGLIQYNIDTALAIMLCASTTKSHDLLIYEWNNGIKYMV